MAQEAPATNLTKVKAIIGSRKEADFNLGMTDPTDKEEARTLIASILGVGADAVDIRAIEPWDNEFLGNFTG